jgi:hypothetical protein
MKTLLGGILLTSLVTTVAFAQGNGGYGYSDCGATKCDPSALAQDSRVKAALSKRSASPAYTPVGGGGCEPVGSRCSCGPLCWGVCNSKGGCQ